MCLPPGESFLYPWAQEESLEPCPEPHQVRSLGSSTHQVRSVEPHLEPSSSQKPKDRPEPSSCQILPTLAYHSTRVTRLSRTLTTDTRTLPGATQGSNMKNPLELATPTLLTAG